MLPKSHFAILLKMSPQQCAAFAAGVTERVFDLYLACAAPYRGDVWEAVKTAWNLASGETAHQATATCLADTLDEEAGGYCDDLKQSIDVPFGVIVAASHTLKAAQSGNPQEAEAAANFASAEVARAAHTYGDKNEQDRAEQEEVKWQLEWLHHVSTSDPSHVREAFRARTVTKPAWQRYWEN
ncbi:hypothetical protein ABZT03_43830 [Streptomyces sp. NPDC005574]|uniref:hypothetical protein n=1 Tax=Streptomyces sp. NPDC005574 TaxID=3156891 RepID=UPI0033B12656